MFPREDGRLGSKALMAQVRHKTVNYLDVREPIGFPQTGDRGRTAAKKRVREGEAARFAVVVLGMHRSGTSAVTRALSLLGPSLPARLLEGLPDNPAGFFEPATIISIHDRMLASFGSSWSSWDRIPSEWWGSAERFAFTEEIGEGIRHDFADSPLFVVKDPRICRFFPIWRDALTRFGTEAIVVLPYRNPIEVAQSLRIRNGFSLQQGLLLWLRHVLDAEHDTRRESRTFLRYEDLVRHPRKTMELVRSSVPIDWPVADEAAFEAIEAFVDEKLRHNVAAAEDVNLRSDVPSWVRDVYDGYEALRLDPHDRAAITRLDSIRRRFDETSSIFAQAFRGFQLQLDEGTRQAERAAALAAELSTVSSDLDQVTGRALAAERELGAVQENLRTVAAVAARVPVLEGFLQGLEDSLKVESDRTAELAATLAEAERSFGLCSTRLRRVRARLAEEAEAARARRAGWASVQTGWRRLTSRTFRIRNRTATQLSRMIAESGLFDPDWYLDQYSDVEDAGFGALEHFVLHGMEEDRRPGPGFDPGWYRGAYADVAQAGCAPLVHYILYGREEGRSPLPEPAGARVAAAASLG